MGALFMIYEVEHGGDLEASLEDLKNAGCKNVKVELVKYEAGKALVACELPPGCEMPADLKLEFACL